MKFQVYKDLQELSELGFEDIPVELLVELKINNITARFIQEARQKSGEDIRLEEILKMRIESYGSFRNFQFFSEDD